MLLWKFKKLDVNKDSVLAGQEIAGIEEQWERIGKQCPIFFNNECDKDRNGNITWSEWKSCFTIKTGFSKSFTPSPGYF